MVEFRIGADWFPTGVGVTLLAGNRDRTVRIGDFGLWATDTGPRAIRRLLQCRARKKREQASGDRYETTYSHHRFLFLLRVQARRGRTVASAVRLRQNRNSACRLTETGALVSAARKLRELVPDEVADFHGNKYHIRRDGLYRRLGCATCEPYDLYGRSALGPSNGQ